MPNDRKRRPAGPSSRWSSPPGPAGPVPFRGRMNGLLAIHAHAGSGWCLQPDLAAEPLVTTLGYTTSGDVICMDWPLEDEAAAAAEFACARLRPGGRSQADEIQRKLLGQALWPWLPGAHSGQV